MLARDHHPLSDQDLSACRAMIREGSKSFYVASLLLPKKVRDAATALYAFCRLSDDLVDSGTNRQAVIADLGRRLERAYAGRPADHVADRAFASVVREYAIPCAVPEALIEGYQWDIAGRSYQSIDDLIAYATRVAATVGVMMTVVMERREAHVLARAADLGVAMQLTNIARDVGEDARNGRIYLPRDWLAEEGVDAAALLEMPTFTPALGRVVKRLLSEADRLYYRGFTGLGDLPAGCQPAICAAGLVYREIGRKIAANGYDSVSTRAYTSKTRKLVLCAQAMFKPTWLFICDMRPALPETQFLVDATAQKNHGGSAFMGALDARMGQLVRLIEVLEHRDRIAFEQGQEGRAD
ncbi:MAG: phytoene/squalene synthase family protein [Rhizobiales bacterium]|nr:phytoene/squalene synthase family protein [Hyphomicrobiales bacterium]